MHTECWETSLSQVIVILTHSFFTSHLNLGNPWLCISLWNTYWHVANGHWGRSSQFDQYHQTTDLFGANQLIYLSHHLRNVLPMKCLWLINVTMSSTISLINCLIWCPLRFHWPVANICPQFYWLITAANINYSFNIYGSTLSCYLYLCVIFC